jgi:hypothetical protein
MSAAKTGSLIVRNALLNDAQTPTNLAIVDGVYADMAAAPPSLP